MSEIGGSNGVRIQRRAQRKDGWTKAKREAFLAVLARTCNATMAAKAVGKAEATARDLRRRDGRFAELWREALDTGYERLEGELLARALGLTPGEDNPDTLPEPAQASAPFDPALAMSVLALRAREKAGTGGSRRSSARTYSQDEIDHALLTRLERLAKRGGGA